MRGSLIGVKDECAGKDGDGDGDLDMRGDDEGMNGVSSSIAIGFVGSAETGQTGRSIVMTLTSEVSPNLAYNGRSEISE